MIATYTIHVHENDDIYREYKYMAVMDDYDGTEDSGRNHLGYGDTQGEAVQDLIENYRFEGE